MDDDLTLDQRIRGDIEARIRSGEWPPGTRIPFEHELVRQYGCARATVSKAMEKLAHAGLIHRRRRAGSFVAWQQEQSAALDVPDPAKIAAERGERYRWKLVRMRKMRGAGDMPGMVLFVTGVHLSNDVPLALEYLTVSLATVPHALSAPFQRISPADWLHERIPWTDARHRIRAVEADVDDVALLDVPLYTACLSMERSTWRAGQAVARLRQLYPGNRYELVAEFSAST